MPPKVLNNFRGTTGVTDNAILLADGTNGAALKTSSKTIVTTLGTDDTTVPTSKAIQDKITSCSTNLTIAVRAAEYLRKGQACYISGTSAGIPLASLVDVTAQGKIRVIGIAQSDMNPGDATIDGFLRRGGTLTGVDCRTTGTVAGYVNPLQQTWMNGELLFALGSHPGGLTNIRPTSGRSVKVCYAVNGNDSACTLLMHPFENPVWITGAVNESVILRTGDEAGATKVSIRDYANNEVASFNSDGKLILPEIKVTGGTPGIGKLLTSDGDGDGTWTLPSIESLGAATDVTTLNATTSAHGLVVKPVDPVTGRYINVVGIGPAETAYTNKALYDDSGNPVMDGSAATGTQLVAARRDHVHASDTSRAPTANPTFTGLVTTPTLKVTTDAAAGKVLVSDADGDLVYTLPKRSIFLSCAGGWLPTTAPAGAITKTETATNKVNFNGTLFAAGASTIYKEFGMPMPKNYGGGTVTAIPYIFVPTSTDASDHTIKLSLAGVSYSSGDAGDAAYGTAVESIITAAASLAGKVVVGAATSAITIAGTPVGADWVQWRIGRTGDDTYTGDITVLGWLISYTTNNHSDE